MHPEVLYSNRTEWLADQLSERLFAPPLDPFARRWILVPTPAMKSWIQTRIAEGMGVAAGIRFLFLEEAVGLLSGHAAPAKDELALRIEAALEQKEMDGLFVPVARFLAMNPKVRLPVLAQQLADHFIQYGLYGGRMVATFAKGSWQEILWQELQLPYWEQLLENATPAPLCDQLHVFGFSHLPPVFYRYLRQASPSVYILSPCVAFWADIRSDRESRAILRQEKARGAPVGQINELGRYLRDRNRLLANFGRLGRQLVSLLEDEISKEHYVHVEPLTVLQQVQADMLALRPPTFRDPDGSIALHSAPSKWREIQVLHQILTETLSNNTVSVLVMAPDIGDYAPLIRAVFQDVIRAQIQDVHQPLPDSVEAGFELLVALAESRWEASNVLELLQHPRFSAFGDVSILRRWVREARIRWGLHAEHRRECFQRDYGSAQLSEATPMTTWEEGLHRLLDALACGGAPPWVEVGDADILQELVVLLSDLPEQLAPLQSGKMTVDQWADYLTALCELYFGHPLPTAPRMRQLGRRLGVTQFSFRSVREIAMRWDARVVRGRDLTAVQFCSMAPMRAIPADVICLIGMHEGAFPRASPKQPLNLLHKSKKADPFPSKVDFDRYLFLESILSARQKLVVTYCHEAEDGHPQGPSLLVAELLSYLGDTTVQRHPQLGHDASYFSSGNYMPYEAYQRACGVKSQAPTIHVSPRSNRQVTVADLSLSLRDPIRLYLNRTLGIHILNLAEQRIEDAETFVLSGLDRHRLLWDQSLPWMLPPTPFRQRAERELQKQRAELTTQLAALAIDPDTLVLHDFIGRSLCLDGWEVTGEVPLACSRGVIHRGNPRLSGVVRSWPAFLAYEGDLLLLKQGAVVARPQDSQEQLRLLLAHYQACLERPVPIAAAWLLEDNVERAVRSDPWLSPSMQWWLQVASIDWDAEVEQLEPLKKLITQIKQVM